jgi:hypothetical protein
MDPKGEDKVAIKVNFGCGSDCRDGWINVDVAEETKWQGTGRKPDRVLWAYYDVRMA